MPKNFLPTQIVLHWLVAVFILLQFISSGPMKEAWSNVEKGLDFVPHPAVFGHVIGGLLVLLFALWRLYLRRTHGVPPLPEEEPPVLRWVANATHTALYVLLLLTPLSGAVAWFGSLESVAFAHEVLKSLLLLFVLLHIAGGLYQQFVLKTNILARMGIGR